MKKVFSVLLLTGILFTFFPAGNVSAESLQISTDSLPDATVGQSYSTEIHVTGGVSPYIWSTISTTYPSGCCVLGLSGNSQPLPGAVTFNAQSSSVVLSPAGTYSWTLKVVDATGASVTKTLGLTIVPAAQPTLVISDPSVSFNYTKGDAVPSSYLAHITNTSNNETINYTISVPNQPSWLGTTYNTNSLPLGPLQSGGVGVAINPTNLAVGTYSTTIYFSGNFSNSPASITVSLTVTSPIKPLQIITTSLPDATIGEAYSGQVQVSGGVSPYGWTTLSTTYPAGCCVLGLSNNGDPISGNSVPFNTQSASTIVNTYPAGLYSWTFQVKDSVGNTTTKTINLNIKPSPSDHNPVAYFQINTSQLPTATAGVYYSAKIDFQYITSGTNYASNVAFNGLPAGITTGSTSSPNTVYGIIYNNPGTVTISGTPTTVGTYTVTLNLTDQYSANLYKQFTLTVNPAPNSIFSPSDVTLPDGALIKLPGSATIYLIVGGKLKPFTSAQNFLDEGYKWSDVQQVNEPKQISNTESNTSGFYPYPSGSLVNDDGTVYFIGSGHAKMAFTNYQAFVGLGYSFRNVIEGDLTNYKSSASQIITTANAAHPWGSWLIFKGTVYYSSKDGLIGVPSGQIFTSNGGGWNLLVKANSYDIGVLNANPNLAPLALNDVRVSK